MAVEYRKTSFGRKFVRIDGDEVITVLIKEYHLAVTEFKSAVVADDYLKDEAVYKPCTKEEFTEQFNIAMSRIKNFKV